MSEPEERMLEHLEPADDALFQERSKPTKVVLDPEAPVLLNQCIQAYNVMYYNRSAETYDVEGPDDEVEVFPLWIGKLTVLLEQECNIPIHTYSRVVAALQEMGCVVQVQKGSRRELGRWALINHPTMKTYEGMSHNRGRKRRVRNSNINKRITQLQEICRDQQRQIDFLLSKVEFDEDEYKEFINGQVERSQ